MKVTMEPVYWVARLHEEDDAKLGDPYVASTSVTIDDTRTANLRGFSMDGFSKLAAEAYVAALKEHGATSMLYVRKKNGKERVVRVAFTD